VAAVGGVLGGLDGGRGRAGLWWGWSGWWWGAGGVVRVGGSVVGGGGGWGAGPVPAAGKLAGLWGRAAGRGRGDRGGGGPPHRLVPRPGRAAPSGLRRVMAADGRRRLRQPAGGAGPGGGRARPRHRPAAGRGAQVVLVDRPHRRGPAAAARGARAGRRAAADAAAGQGGPGSGDARDVAHPDPGHHRRGPAQPGAVRAVRGPSGGRLLQAHPGLRRAAAQRSQRRRPPAGRGGRSHLRGARRPMGGGVRRPRPAGVRGLLPRGARVGRGGGPAGPGAVPGPRRPVGRGPVAVRRRGVRQGPG
jgi:hypothetical protein